MPIDRATFITAWAEFSGGGEPPPVPDVVLAGIPSVETLSTLLETCLATEVQGWFLKPTVTRAGVTATGDVDRTVGCAPRPLGWWAALIAVLAEQGWEELSIEPDRHNEWCIVVTRAATPAEIAELDRELAEAAAEAEAIEEARDRALYEQLKARFEPVNDPAPPRRAGP